MIKIQSVCVLLSVWLLPVSLLLDSFPAHKSHVSTRHFASLLGLRAVPGLADQAFEICDPHGVAFKCALTSSRHFAAALLSSSGATPTLPPQLYRNLTPATLKHPAVSFTVFQHSPLVEGQIEMTVEVAAVSCAEGNLFSGFAGVKVKRKFGSRLSLTVNSGVHATGDKLHLHFQ